MRIRLLLLSLVYSCSVSAQNVTVNGTFVYQLPTPVSVQIEVRKEDSPYNIVNTFSDRKFSVALNGTGEYDLFFKLKDTVINHYRIKNRLSESSQGLTIEIKLPESPQPIDSADIARKAAANDLYLKAHLNNSNKKYYKNNRPITQITFDFETNRKKAAAEELRIEKEKKRKKKLIKKLFTNR